MSGIRVVVLRTLLKSEPCSYWDNVAGPTLDAALVNFNDNGLIVACGAIGDASGGDGNSVKVY